MQSFLTPLAAVGLREVALTPLDERVLGCSFGHYPWDDWERAAKDAGVPEKLAALGRAVMREAYNHAWEDRLKSLCGWRDDGKRMIAFALRSPEKAATRWETLLRTDGRRGDYHPQTGEWTWGYRRPKT